MDIMDRVESQIDRDHEDAFSTESFLSCCNICGTLYDEDNACFYISSKVGNALIADDAYVCSKECCEDWLEKTDITEHGE